MVEEVLDQEIETYRQNLPSLLLEEGKFVLIHGGELVGIFDTYQDALTAGYEKFGVRPFLVKQIKAIEQVHLLHEELLPFPMPFPCSTIPSLSAPNAAYVGQWLVLQPQPYKQGRVNESTRRGWPSPK